MNRSEYNKEIAQKIAEKQQQIMEKQRDAQIVEIKIQKFQEV